MTSEGRGCTLQEMEQENKSAIKIRQEIDQIIRDVPIKHNGYSYEEVEGVLQKLRKAIGWIG